MLVMQALASILLEMKPLDTDDHTLTAEEIDDDLALADEWVLVLADLIALRQVWIKIVLPVEDRVEIDLCLQRKPGADCLRKAALVNDGKHSGHGGIDQAHMRVWLAAELGRSAGEQLGVGGDLGMHFHADHHLPLTGGAFDKIARFRAFLHFGYITPSVVTVIAWLDRAIQ